MEVKPTEVLCTTCGKPVDDENGIYTMDQYGCMFAYCSEACYDANTQMEVNRGMSGLGMSGGSRGGFGSMGGF